MTRILSKSLLAICIAFFSATAAFSQNPFLEWAFSFGGATTSEVGKAITVDDSGNILLVGRFTGTVDLDPGPAVQSFTALGANDEFILKMDASRNVIWIKQFASNATADFLAITTDATGNVYVTGSFNNTFDFDPGTGIANLVSVGVQDAFALKLDQDGNFLWAGRTASSTNTDQGNSIAVDAVGNVYTTGIFSGVSDFDPSAAVFNLTGAGSNDFYVSKLDNTGAFVWAVSVGGTGDDQANFLDVDDSGNVFVTGGFSSLVDFDPGAGITTATAAGGTDIFILSLDTDKVFRFVKTVGSGSSETGQSINVDAISNLKISGRFSATVDFDPGAGTFNLAPGSGIFDLVLTSNGNFVSASARPGSLANPSNSTGNLVALDGAGNVYTTGGFVGSFDIDPSCEVFTLTSAGGTDIFVRKVYFLTPPTPTISSFAPTNGVVGSNVTITGTNFSATPSENTVMFSNGVLATVTASTSTTIDVTVPVGAVTGIISVTVKCEYVASATTFTVGAGSSPTITSFTPTSGVVGTTVTITGTNFSATPANNTVQFNGTAATVSASTTTSITCTVPAGATTGKISVTVGGNTATSTNDFTVTSPPPTITSFTPTSGLVDATVTITGTNFSTTPLNNTVKFNGTTATVSASTSTSITCAVPTGATTGKITVTVGANTATSTNDFTVTTPLPTITSFTPTSGLVGASVTITGTNFANIPANNIVKFNGTTATVSSSSLTSITCTVPTGATTGKITVSIGVNTATSANDFTVTPNPTINITQQPFAVTACAGSIASLTVAAAGTTNITYRWQAQGPDLSFSDISDGGAFTGTTLGTLSINTSVGVVPTVYRCRVNGDLAPQVISGQGTLTISPLPSAPTASDLTICAISTASLTATGAADGQYRWYTVSVGGVAINGAVNGTYTTPALSAGATYYVAINNGLCEGPRTKVTVTVSGICNAPPVFTATPLTIPVQGKVTLDLTTILSDVDANLDLSSLKVVQAPTSGAIASIDANSVLTVDYTGTTFSGTDGLTIEACDLAGACDQEQLSIEVVGDVVVYNAVSPGGDKKNDAFVIEYIDAIPGTKKNHVKIFNRWGDLVFSIDDYNNADRIFAGQNSHGNELPSGVYYYRVTFDSGIKALEGYLVLRR